MPLLSISGLRVRLGGTTVLDGLDMTVGAGEFVGLIGPNGAGKSTLLRAALGLLPHAGTVLLDGVDAATLSARDRAEKAAYLAQEREIAWAVPVETVVALGRAPHQRSFAALGPRDHAIVDEAMRRMDVASFRGRLATELSGGEKARVLTARALAQDTPLLLADEPTAGLDPSHQIALMRVFRELAASGRGVVASLHDLGLAARWCSRIVLVAQGRVIAEGAPAEVLTPERLRAVYGVSAFFAEAGGAPVILPLDLAERVD
ncbi:ABC transporter ATP-binding protein [Aquamicrobium segne]|uniref:ABC transporter ATP-binding protein n=1 Tax=Aquamicrobium segne TaxID=469547 RepID=A0ABW0GU35_9HYPH